MFTVYLAGRIDGLTLEEANAQRQDIAEKLGRFGVLCRNPLRGKAKILNSVGKINATEVKNCGLTIQEIIRRDLNDVEQSNVVLILTGDQPSWGTSAEFWYSTFVVHKPTLVVSKNNYNIVGNNWLTYYATKIVQDVDSAVEVLKLWSIYWDDGSGVNDTV